MAAVISICIDMDHDKARHRKGSDRCDEICATFVAAAMPVHLGLINAQALQRLPHMCDIVVIAQRRGEQVRARI
jgi:hypothetical protein